MVGWDKEDDETLGNIKKFGKSIIYFIVIFIIFFGSFFVVQPGERGLIFNTFSGLKENIYQEGFHFKFPLLDRVIKMNIRTQKQSEDATAASKDLQDVSANVAVNFIVDPTKLVNTYRTIGAATENQDYMQTQIMNPIIQESVKSTTAHYTAEELISKRPIVKEELDKLIKERMLKYNINVIDVSITNFKFSDTFTKAIEEKVTAEQNALKEENNLKVVEFQAQQKVETAKGDAQSIEIINQELQKSPQYINYLTIKTWNGVMPLSLGSGTLLSINPANTPQTVVVENKK